MKNWIKMLCLCALITGVTGERAEAESEKRARGDAVSETSERGEDRPKPAAGGDAKRTRQKPAGAIDRPDAAAGSDATKAEQARSEKKNSAARAELPEQTAQGQAKRAAAMARQQEKFDGIHARRMAQLQRLRELAVENGREEVVSRVDQQIEREQKRYTRQKDRPEQRDKAK